MRALAQGSKFKVQGSKFKVQSSKLKAQSSEFKAVATAAGGIVSHFKNKCC